MEYQPRRIAHDVVEIVPVSPSGQSATEQAQHILDAAAEALARGNRPAAMELTREAMGQLILADSADRQAQRMSIITARKHDDCRTCAGAAS